VGECKKDKMRKLLVILLFLNYGVIAQVNSTMFPSEKKLSHFVVENWTKEDGLPSNSLLNIIQTKDGYIWVSSYDGLIRFDGIDFTIFNNSNTDAFDANGIGAMAEDSKGVLWMTTQNSGLISYSNNEFKSHQIKNKLEHLHRIIFIDRDDKIWSSDVAGQLFYYHNDSCTFINNPKLPQNAIYSNIKQDQKDVIWIATEGRGIYKIVNGEITNYTQKNGLLSNWVSSLSFDKNGLLWIGTDKGVSVFDGEKFQTIEPLVGRTINNIIADQPNAIWISSNSGVLRMIKKTQKVELLQENNGLASNHTIEMMFDNEHSLWVIHYKGGLSRIKNAMFITLTKSDNLLGTIVNTLCQIDSKSILIGFNNGRINKISNNKITEFRPKKNIYGYRIRDIFKDSKNNLWIATYRGLLKIEPNGMEKWFAPSTGFPAKYIRVIYENQQGEIWVGTRNSGLINITNEKALQIINKSNGLNNNLIMSIDEDRFGNMIVGISKGGLHIISNNAVVKKYTIKDGLFSDIVFNTYIDDNDVIWVAVKGGINWIIDGKVHGINTNPYIMPQSPYDILEDKKHYLWIPGSNGILRVKKSALFAYEQNPQKIIQHRMFGNQDGIKQPECTSTSSSMTDQDNNMWFPTINGVIKVNPQKEYTNTYMPPVYIEKIIADGKTLSPNEDIQTKAGTDRIVFYFTALSYYYPQKVQFKHRLLGYQKEWSDYTGQRSISFTNLPPGDYTFHVIGSNNNDVWNEEGAKISFSINPFWYQKKWVSALATFFILFLIYMVYYLRIRQIKRRQTLLKELVQQRTEEIEEKNRKIQARNEEILQVTEEIQSQNEEIQVINEELEKLSIVASETDNAIRILNSNGQAEWANNAFTKLYGYTLKEITTMDYPNLLAGDTKGGKEAINKCLSKKVTVIYTEERKTKAGNSIWVQTTLSPILNQQNTIVKLVAIDSDVTKLKLAEEKIRKQKIELENYQNERTHELKIAKEKAEESDTLKTAFLTNMSHEIRTPMNAIVGFADLLGQPETEPSEFPDFIQQINTNSEALLHLIDDIVEVSRIECNQLYIRTKTYNLNDVLSELHQEYLIKTETNNDIEMRLFLEQRTDLKINTDKSRLQQALSHLINNAIKYTDEGFVELGYLIKENKIRIYVKDTGIGLKKEDIPIIFDRFRKIEDNPVKLYRGAGLGLYITNKVVNALNGEISVESEPGKGSTFIIDFPYTGF
jgi:PAS domain S-box-containing protein